MPGGQMAATDDRVFIVIREFPDIYMEIDRVFLEEDNAHEYITDTYPYFSYYPDHDIYAMSDLSEEDLQNEERYYIIERFLAD